MDLQEVDYIQKYHGLQKDTSFNLPQGNKKEKGRQLGQTVDIQHFCSRDKAVVLTLWVPSLTILTKQISDKIFQCSVECPAARKDR